MKYADFVGIMSEERMSRYLSACNGDTRKTMKLYRDNLHLSQDMFTVVSCFEVALRNAIDAKMKIRWGDDWLRDSIHPGGIFDDPRMLQTKRIIEKAYRGLVRDGSYTHSKLLAEMEFGIWKYMFSQHQYHASGSFLLNIFPNKPRSSRNQQYNHRYIFNELDKVNTLRNRIAHHEPICFVRGIVEPDTSYVVNEYRNIQTLFNWMGIDSAALLYGLDHVINICNDIR